MGLDPGRTINRSFALIRPKVMPMFFEMVSIASLIGGLIFGLEWGLLGYCPGTSVGALGEGRWDALWGIVGMIAGAAIFAEAFPILKKSILTWGDFGKITLPQIIGLNHWIVIFVLLVCGLALFGFFRKKRL